MSCGVTKKSVLGTHPRALNKLRVLHFRPLIWDRWTQALEVTSGQLLPDQEVPLLQRRTRLSRVQAIRLWKHRRAEGWTPCAPQWNPPPLLLQ
jgi:hypothetical protein